MDIRLQQEALRKVENSLNDLENQLNLLNEGEDYNRLKGVINKLDDIKNKVINGSEVAIQIVLNEM
ncbi:MAG: hypothetical protein HXK68_01600 [Clostridiales bacterium]|mgnify:FL=1|nr:hypothetical protein [Clostridiales bacterium]